MEAEAKLVLLVDDEPVVLQLMQRVVEQAGYTVLTAADGTQAQAIAEATTEPITVVVLDGTIPPGGAADAAVQILAQHPDAALVITSGASLAPREQQCIDQFGGRFLAKPFSPRALMDFFSSVPADPARGGE